MRLQVLPHRAKTVFAVRCARRVQPLFCLPDEHPFLAEYGRLLDRCLDQVEAYAAGNLEQSEMHRATDAAHAALVAAAECCDDADASTLAAATARAAARDAAELTSVNRDSLSDFPAHQLSLRAATLAGSPEILHPILQDLSQLSAHAHEHTDRFDPSETGPLGLLWPHNAPTWFTSYWSLPRPLILPDLRPQGDANDLDEFQRGLIDDARWVSTAEDEGTLDTHRGHYVAVFQQTVLGAGDDPRALCLQAATTHRLDPQRLTIHYVRKEPW